VLKAINRISGKLALMLAAVTLAVSAVGVLPLFTSSTVSAAAKVLPLDMIYYGWHDTATDQRIVAAHPLALVSNSPAGPWRGNANISLFTGAGINYYEYIDGGYEGSVARPIPDDLQSNLNYIAAAARAGVYGIFLDEVSDGVYTPANYSYLQQIADKAHSLGLKVVFNTGMFAWADQLMNLCDYINSSETWSNTPLTASQSKWASRTWLLTYGVYDASTAANLTIGAWSKGISAQYTCGAFGQLPEWLETYVSQVAAYAPTVQSNGPVTVSAPVTGQAQVTFSSSSAGTEVWLDYSYKGVTPLTLTVSAGSHHIGFNKYGTHNNTPVEGDFTAGNTAISITADMSAGQISNNSSTATVYSGPAAVTFSSNVAGAEVWVDYVYKGVGPITITLSAGSHHMGFYKYGYNNNQAVTFDFSISGQSTLNIYGDLVSGTASIR
jgi:uncharacterized lipoprotein YehR (DUF1307 family)